MRSASSPVRVLTREPVLSAPRLLAVSSVVKAVFAAVRAVAEKQAPTEVDVLSAYSKLAVFLDEIVQEVRPP